MTDWAVGQVIRVIHNCVLYFSPKNANWVVNQHLKYLSPLVFEGRPSKPSVALRSGTCQRMMLVCFHYYKAPRELTPMGRFLLFPALDSLRTSLTTYRFWPPLSKISNLTVSRIFQITSTVDIPAKKFL